MSAAGLPSERAAPTRVRAAERQMQAESSSADGCSLHRDPLHYCTCTADACCLPCSPNFSPMIAPALHWEKPCSDSVPAVGLWVKAGWCFFPFPLHISSRMGQCQRFQENLAFADLAAMMGPFLLSVKPEKKDKGRKRTLLSTCPLILSPRSSNGRHRWGCAALSEQSKQKCRAAEGLGAKRRAHSG